jgi:hypothetical protein
MLGLPRKQESASQPHSAREVRKTTPYGGKPPGGPDDSRTRNLARMLGSCYHSLPRRGIARRCLAILMVLELAHAPHLSGLKPGSLPETFTNA